MKKSGLPLTILAFLIFALGIYLRIVSLKSSAFWGEEYAIRDIERTWEWLEGFDFPLVGPEALSGSRLPGPFLYLLLAPALLIKASYESIFVWNFILNLASIGVFAWGLARFSGMASALVGSILLSLNISHIEAVAYSINPSFAFVLIAGFMAFFLEAVRTRYPKFLIFAFITAVLGMQIHFSLALLLLPTLGLTWVYRKNFTLKHVMTLVLMLTICMIPWTIYQMRYFEADIKTAKQLFTTSNWGIDFLWRFFKALTNWDVLLRTWNLSLYESCATAWGAFKLKGPFSWLGYFWLAATGVSMIVIFKSRMPRVNRYALISLLWAPAVLFTLLNPAYYNLRYSYVFILPCIALIAVAASLGFHAFRLSRLRYGFFFLGLVVFGLQARESTLVIKNLYAAKSASLMGTYANTELFYGRIMQSLALTAEDVFNRVYFYKPQPPYALYMRTNEFIPYSLHRLKEAENKYAPHLLNTPARRTGFFLKQTKHRSQDCSTTSAIPDYYDIANDPSLSIVSKKTLSFANDGFPDEFEIIEYQPAEGEDPYTNAFNPFLWADGTAAMLMTAKKTQEFETTITKESWNSDGTLKNLELSVTGVDKVYGIPLQVRMAIRKDDQQIILETETNRFEFYTTPYFVNNVVIEAFQNKELVAKWVVISEDRLEGMNANFRKWHKSFKWKGQLRHPETTLKLSYWAHSDKSQKRTVVLYPSGEK